MKKIIICLLGALSFIGVAKADSGFMFVNESPKNSIQVYSLLCHNQQGENHRICDDKTYSTQVISPLGYYSLPIPTEMTNDDELVVTQVNVILPDGSQVVRNIQNALENSDCNFYTATPKLGNTFYISGDNKIVICKFGQIAE